MRTLLTVSVLDGTPAHKVVETKGEMTTRGYRQEGASGFRQSFGTSQRDRVLNKKQ
jgi:hypothetical protein